MPGRISNGSMNVLPLELASRLRSPTRSPAIARPIRQPVALAESRPHRGPARPARTAVGQAGLWLRNLGEGRASTGYWVAARFRRRHYATAALEAISRWGLSLEGIHRIELYVEPWNEGSWRAAERVGYVREACCAAGSR